MSEYILGNIVRCTARFFDQNGDLEDPQGVFFKVKNPAGTITTYTAEVDVELVHDGDGLYHVDVDANAYGVWYYRFYSTGLGTAADEKSFSVPKSEFS